MQEELVTRLGKKLVVLTNEQTMLVDESTANDVLGNDVSLKVAQKVRPGDSTKFRSYVDDVGYITMLLLSLSGRLARTENALHSIGEKTADKVRVVEFVMVSEMKFNCFCNFRKFWKQNVIDCWSNWMKQSI